MIDKYETFAFKRWFGNSKIIENGNPLICYHGTDNDFIEFDFTKIGYNTGNFGHYGYGIYFSTDIREAKIYGKNIYECYLRIENPFTGTEQQILELKENGIGNIDDLDVLSIDFDSFKKSFKSNTNIYKFIDSIEKIGIEKTWDKIREDSKQKIDLDLLNDITDIIEYTTLNKDVHGVPDYVLDELKKLNITPNLNKGFMYSQSLHWVTNLGNASKEVTDIIKKLGYDGVWYGSEIIAFEPNQIKSINNKGTFKLTSKNIYENNKIN